MSRPRRGGSSWAAAGAPHLGNAAGRVWFEVEVVQAKGRALVGIAGTNFNGFPTVGTDAASWSIYLDTGAGGVLHSRHALIQNLHSVACVWCHLPARSIVLK